MKAYIGTKHVNAKPMTRGEYNAFRGWDIPEGEDPADAGYLVEYVDGGKANTREYKGYVSWSPKDVFERAYVEFNPPADGSINLMLRPPMTFGDALSRLKLGQKLAREGWNGKGMFLFLVNGSTFKVNRAPLLGIYPEGTEINYRAHIDMKTADGSVVPWVASQTDLLADDWVVVP